MLLRCVLGRLPWSAKVKPRPDETWEEGAHGAAVVYLVVFAGGWEKVGITMDYGIPLVTPSQLGGGI